jgi:hypothetical protein
MSENENHTATPAAARPAQRRAMSVSDFVRDYGIGRTRAFEMIASGELPSIAIGGRRLITVDGAEALLRGSAKPHARIRTAPRRARRTEA